MAKNEEREFRLRPRKPFGRGPDEIAAWSKAFKVLIHHARNSRVTKRSVRGLAYYAKPSHQRCAVRVTYSRNIVKGQWRAHGRYLVRESAAGEKDRISPGFDSSGMAIDASAVLQAWQRAGDERLWKLIVSPEFGEKIDLVRLARGLMDSVGQQIGRPLEWVVVAHYNTEHPHVHVALRGVDRNGHTLRMDRDFIKSGIRTIAEDLCTRQIGHRTERDIEEAVAREVREQRFTSLDRTILHMGQPSAAPQAFRVEIAGDSSRGRKRHAAARLMYLEKAGLARSLGPGSWEVREDFGAVLRSMQTATDRQRTLSAHGALISDPRLPFAALDLKTLASVEGRVLVHGEEEQGRGAGSCYFLLEGTDARIYYIPYLPGIEVARGQGKLNVNSFVRLRKLFAGGVPSIDVKDFGPAEGILRNRSYLENVASAIGSRSTLPVDEGWGGWLGRYQAAVRDTVLSVGRHRETGLKQHER